MTTIGDVINRAKAIFDLIMTVFKYFSSLFSKEEDKEEEKAEETE